MFTDVLFLGDLRFFIPMRDNYILFYELDVELVARSPVPDDGFTTVLLVASLLSVLGFVSAALALVFSEMLIHSFNVGARNCAAPLLLLTDTPVTPTSPTAFPVVHRILLHVDLFVDSIKGHKLEAQLLSVTKFPFHVFASVRRLRLLCPIAICNVSPDDIPVILKTGKSLVLGTIQPSRYHRFQLCTEDDIGPLFPRSWVKSDFKNTSDDVAAEIAWYTRMYGRQIPAAEFCRQFVELNNSDLTPTTCTELMAVPVDKVPAGPASPPITGVGLRTPTRVSMGVALQADTTAATADAPTNHEQSNEDRPSVNDVKAMFGG